MPRIHSKKTDGTSTRQSRVVWAITFAAIGVFMGIGVVSPILRPLATELGGTASQVSLLLTSYLAVMSVTMLVTGAVSSRIGIRNTLLLGLFVIAASAVCVSLSGTIGQIIGFRAGWGMGNALFVATGLAAIVGAATGGTAKAVVYYESAVGIGVATGPLAGGLLGEISWQAAFLGIAILSAVAFVILTVILPSGGRTPTPFSLIDPFRALRHRGLLSIAVASSLYNFGYFTVLAYAPFALGFRARESGLVFFGLGVCLAVSSIFVAPRLRERFGVVPTTVLSMALFALTLAVMAIFVTTVLIVVACVVVAGLFLGVLNTLVSELAMDAASVERGTASAAYNCLRFSGAAVAPWLTSTLGEKFSSHIPFAVAALTVIVGAVVVMNGRRFLPSQYALPMRRHQRTLHEEVVS